MLKPLKPESRGALGMSCMFLLLSESGQCFHPKHRALLCWGQHTFFFFLVHPYDTGWTCLCANGLLSTLQSVARLSSYKDYLLMKRGRLFNVGGLTINSVKRERNLILKGHLWHNEVVALQTFWHDIGFAPLAAHILDLCWTSVCVSLRPLSVIQWSTKHQWVLRNYGLAGSLFALLIESFSRRMRISRFKKKESFPFSR